MDTVRIRFNQAHETKKADRKKCRKFERGEVVELSPGSARHFTSRGVADLVTNTSPDAADDEADDAADGAAEATEVKTGRKRKSRSTGAQ